MAVRKAAASMRSKLRWEPRDEVLPSRDRPTVARTFIYLYGLGGTLVLASLAFADVSDRWWPGVAGPALAAYAVTALLLFRFDRLPWWFFVALPPMGAVLITVVAASGGAELITVYATLYFWVMLSAAFFFSVRAILLNLALIALLYAGILATTPAATHPSLRLLMVLGTLAVVAAVIGALRGRAERLLEVVGRRALKQEKVAELGKSALAGAELSELSALTAEAISDALGVEYAAVFSISPDSDRLLVKTGVGWRPEILHQATVAAADPLLERALVSKDPVIVDDYAERLDACGYTGPLRETASGIAIAIAGPSEPLGVLAAYSREPRSFSSTEAAFLQAVAHVVGDANERQRVAEEREHRALHDHLTGRPNRSLFTDRLGEALIRSQQQGSLLAVLFLDIDDFKLVNDGFGHGAGDELLKAFGPRLREALVMTDTVARFGGDEFAVLCEDVEGESHAIEIAERLRKALTRPFEIGGAPYHVSASIGVALSTGIVGGEELIAHADAAMYRAKEKTRGGYEFFDQALRARVRMRLEFESALRSAPDDDQLHLVVQPIVALPSGTPVGSEVLLRWRHPDLGPVSPAEFIPVAEESGAILPIGEWVLEQAFTLAAKWRSDPSHRRLLPLHINVSARQLAQQDFVAQVKEQLEATGARVRDLAFEITEHALLGDAGATVETLAGLQTLGFAIVLDDFGTGYSSLSHLKRFPIDTVKVDRSFISNLTSEKRDEAIVSAVLGMADAFALDVVAEGIETPEQVARLAKLGCRFGQGFYFAKPMPVDEIVIEPSARLNQTRAAAELDLGKVQPSEAIPTASSASSLEE